MIDSQEFDWRGEYDENLPLPQRLTREQYDRVIFRPDAHFVDGAIVSRNLGDSVHSRAIVALIGALYEPSKAHGLHSCISLRLQTSPTRVRVCDFVTLNADAPREGVPTVPPLLCIEVLAPNQSSQAEQEVLDDYLAMGVPNIWLIDPIRRAAFTYDFDGLHVADTTQLGVANTPIMIDLSEALAGVD